MSNKKGCKVLGDKNYEIWNDEKYLIPTEDIKYLACIGDYTIVEISLNQLEYLPLLKELLITKSTIDDLIIMLNGKLDFKVKDNLELKEYLKISFPEFNKEFIITPLTEPYVDVKEALIFNYSTNEFEKLSSYDSHKAFIYWDGHNHKTIFCSYSFPVAAYGSKVSLDEWDGNNLTTGGM